MNYMKSKLTKEEDIQKYINNYWLGLGDTSKLIILNNPLLNRTDDEIERPDLHTIAIMRNPDYFSFTCKRLFNITIGPMQAAILKEMWLRPFPMLIMSRGGGKSWLLALYCMLKLTLIPETKIVIVGAAFRQSKVIFDYMETMWVNSPILQDIMSHDRIAGPRRDIDRCTMHLNDGWAIAIPLGNGDKIRGLRAHIIIADEFSVINPEIYETVVSGFTSVSAAPMVGVQVAAKRKAMKELGIWSEELEEGYKGRRQNQSILSGTCDYAFENFAKYWQRYHNIIHSKGDPNRLKEILNVEDLDMENFDYRDYSIIRVPYEVIPEGFMDSKTVTRAKATSHSGIYAKEYGAVFPNDSDGFFKRTLINACTTSEQAPIIINGRSIWFNAGITGHPNLRYVYGIDPASENDNFAIVVLELHPDHTRVVYSWTTTRSKFNQQKNLGHSTENTFFHYCGRKIRDLMKVFPCARIGIDSQGGGYVLEETLHDPDKIEGNEQLIWQVIDDLKEKPTDGKPGLHILELIQFANAEWTAVANNGLKKDMEDRVLLFPQLNSVDLALAVESDYIASKRGDSTKISESLEDCVLEIEELKDELSTIVKTQTTAANRDRWDTPEIKLPNGKKGRMRKDRYSALLIANMLARQIHRAEEKLTYDVVGGFAQQQDTRKRDRKAKMYNGPDWFSQSGNSAAAFYGQVKRK